MFERWKAKRELKKSAKLIEWLASNLPSTTLRMMFPDIEPRDSCNMLLDVARRIQREL